MFRSERERPSNFGSEKSGTARRNKITFSQYRLLMYNGITMPYGALWGQEMAENVSGRLGDGACDYGISMFSYFSNYNLGMLLGSEQVDTGEYWSTGRRERRKKLLVGKEVLARPVGVPE